MSVKTILFIFIFIFCAGITSGAYALYEQKDSIYFMLDDGELSPEEMDEEAMYVFGQCSGNFIQRVYFNCSCISGAFRQEREKQGAFVPQSIIVDDLFNDNERGCANSIGIAGETYRFCNEYARTFRSRNKNNEQYCSCVANTMARSFKKDPYLGTRHIEKLRGDAMLSCN